MNTEGGEQSTPAPGVRPPGRSTVRLPGWLVRSPLYAGWLWTGAWALLILADEYLDLAGWAWYACVGMAALPTLGCTMAVLHTSSCGSWR